MGRGLSHRARLDSRPFLFAHLGSRHPTEAAGLGIAVQHVATLLVISLIGIDREVLLRVSSLRAAVFTRGKWLIAASEGQDDLGEFIPGESCDRQAAPTNMAKSEGRRPSRKAAEMDVSPL